MSNEPPFICRMVKMGSWSDEVVFGIQGDDSTTSVGLDPELWARLGSPIALTVTVEAERDY